MKISRTTDPVNKVWKIRQAVQKITDADFEELTAMSEDQRDYISPLKILKQVKANNLGDHNLKVIGLLKELRKVLEEGKEIYKS